MEYAAQPNALKSKTFILLLLALLAIGAGLRIYGAWAYRCEDSSDRGRICLMAKHMSEGVDFPVFGYGFAYLGTLEPGVSALICRLFGCNGFAVNLGTVLFGILLLPIIYLWARDMSGGLAGLTALTSALVGTFGLFFFSFIPRGGYAAPVAFGTLVLWLTGKITWEYRRGRQPAEGWFWLMGFCAGLGWWSDQLIIYALATAALWLTLAVKGRVCNRRFIGGLAAFFIGSAPWWFWNATHGWITLNSAGAIGLRWLPQGLRWLLTDRIYRLLDLPLEFTAANAILPLGLVLVLSTAVGRWIILRRDRSLPAERFHLGVALTMIGISVLIYACTYFASIESERYLLPLIPVFAVLFGHATARLARRIGTLPALIPLGLLLIWQSQVLRKEFKPDDGRSAWEAARQLGSFASAQRLDVVFSQIWEHWISFATDEAAKICDLSVEPYAPYEKAGELAEKYGVLNNTGNPQAFLQAAGGACRETNFGSFRLAYDFHPPLQPVRPWQLHPGIAISDAAGHDLRSALTDRDLDTGWDNRRGNGPLAYLDCILPDSPVIAGIRLRCREGNYPGYCRLLGRHPDQTNWFELKSRDRTTSLFWSGPRWYASGLFYRMELRFHPQTVTALRLDFADDEGNPGIIDIAEVDFLEPLPASDGPGGHSDYFPARLPEIIRSSGVKTVYADRWLSHETHRRLNGAVQTIQPSFMARSVYGLQNTIAEEYADLTRITPETAFLVPAAEAEDNLELLKSCGLQMRATPAGPLTLLTFVPGGWNKANATWPGLQWAGYGLLRLPADRYAKQRAQWLFEQATATNDAAAEPLLDLALAVYPRHEPALQLKAQLLRRQGRNAQTQAADGLIRSSFSPAHPVRIRMANGAILCGYNLEPPAPGASDFRMTYFWTCPPGASRPGLRVFVHFEKDDVLFQDDHDFMAGIAPGYLAYQPYPELFAVERVVRLPSGTPPGHYAISLGLFTPANDRRLTAQTDLPQHDRAVELPTRLYRP